MSSTEVECLSDSVAVYIGRQPIVDRAGALVAYELLFRRGPTNAAAVVDDTAATLQVIANAMGEFGIQKVLGDQRGYLNIGSELLGDDMLGLLSPEQFVLEIIETIPRDAILEAQCRALRCAGFALALDDVVDLSEMPENIVRLVDVVKIDYPRVNARELPRLIEAAHRAGARVLAEKVETAKDYHALHALGVDLFQGYFFAHPQMLKQRKLGNSAGDLLNLMSALLEESTIEKLEPIIKRNPPVLLHLMKLASSTLFGARKPVSTIGEAIMRVGTHTLVRWMQLLIYAAGSDVPLQRSPLIHLVATRARFLELVARLIEPHDSGFSDRAYQVGIYSLMHFMVGVSAQELMEQLAVAPDVREAIVHGRGVLGSLQSLADRVEAGQALELDALPCLAGKLVERDVGPIAAKAAAWAVDHIGTGA